MQGRELFPMAGTFKTGVEMVSKDCIICEGQIWVTPCQSRP